jgi:hypothetical protein
VLLPEAGSADEANLVLQSLARELFEMELEPWTSDTRHWPAERNYSRFLEWFEVEFHVLVVDAATVELHREPYS